ncbi:MAG: M20/M25/M40 family metallo-hydrolase [Thermoleophilia bacterium]
MSGVKVDTLRDLFVALAEIRSPSGEERAIADFVHTYVTESGLVALEDGTAISSASAGNLVIRVPGRGLGIPLALCAHLDTVPLAHAPRVTVEDGVVRSDGSTILGADDKAAVAALLALLRDAVANPPDADVEILLTTGEEVGLRGAKAFDLATLRARVVFVFDSAGPPGSVIVGAPTHKLVTAAFRGIAAHAGMAPEDGRSAILAAARAIAHLRLGRIDDETTTNVGLINGGEATNIVPRDCLVHAEARSRDDAKVAAEVTRMIEAFTLAATETGIDVDIEVVDQYQSYRHAPDSLPVRLAEAAAAEAGLDFSPYSGNGGSDANVFNARGLPALTLGVGFERVHSPAECMRLDRLTQVYDLAHALVRTAGATRS